MNSGVGRLPPASFLTRWGSVQLSTVKCDGLGDVALVLFISLKSVIPSSPSLLEPFTRTVRWLLNLCITMHCSFKTLLDSIF